MIYITTDNDGYVVSIQKPSIDPVASKNKAKSAMLEDEKLVSNTNEISRLDRLISKSKINKKLIQKKNNLAVECKKSIENHLRKNKVFFAPQKNTFISEIEEDDAVAFVRSKNRTQLVKLIDDTLNYVDNYVGIEFFEKKNKKWTKYTIGEIGIAPNTKWIRKEDLSIEQHKAILLQNETEEQRMSKLEQQAKNAFLNRIFRESDEYKKIGN